VSIEGQTLRRFFELPLVRNEHPALALSWTLYHVLDEQSPLYGLDAEDFAASDVSLDQLVRAFTAAGGTFVVRDETKKPTKSKQPKSTSRTIVLEMVGSRRNS